MKFIAHWLKVFFWSYLIIGYVLIQSWNETDSIVSIGCVIHFICNNLVMNWIAKAIKQTTSIFKLVQSLYSFESFNVILWGLAWISI